MDKSGADFESLIGKVFDFYGAAEHKFRLNDPGWHSICLTCEQINDLEEYAPKQEEP